VTEDDGVGGRKASPHARQPAFGGAGIVSYGDGSPVDLDLQLGRQGAPQRLLIDIAVHSMDNRAESLHFLQRRSGEEVTGMDYGLGRHDQLDAALGQSAGSLRHMGVGEDGNQASRF
jgi:hypothetical protein